MSLSYQSYFLTDIPHPYNNIGDGPEGPECAKIADSLNRSMAGKILASINIEKGAKHERLDQVPLPRKIVKVESHGKKILFYLEQTDEDKEEIIIGNELLMSGHWSRKRVKWTLFSFILLDGDTFTFLSLVRLDELEHFSQLNKKKSISPE